ncbi:(2Fe-2S)-binding protein [Candidatus Marsarchaeota G1 archaeon OSP_B]|jgi:xanthine dehydrogenase YagT iron-sulfur-binding subunit|uniref:(2Fe-2S)-binding protein n=4 Tax=Candidatus Marsarchaeota group 1 TaxID=2203770 RepID=A0A2R6AI36_9ARCH|nr:MAG: (2Fe-2S)-binding protein [Candidatus Marsarchaeota G1 archaeon OSP_D]PSN85999.1 MAG: (2Fe-2S)-binding protein [Candidatus Marsarchaeota G1 archaeon BE_D]PSN88219.1 MAG: (2Fe-2S)-binding protein [Candidatus Marsarchaeota G1 archaeon OSP_C]PSN89922.1 MAG: (2Fe-2S)-binding protein [Candidatus Marsarchaeota G1 archaeon OSP_B]
MSFVRVSFQVNGSRVSVFVEPRTTLLDVLRKKLGLTGAKKGCDMGNCGACTVLVNGKSRLSCLTFAVQVDGMEITTVEGLSRGDSLDALQESFIRNDALQCGFCTPGQIMSAKFLLSVNPHPTLEEIKRYMAGNLCRCGAYPKIFRAIEEASRGVLSEAR